MSKLVQCLNNLGRGTLNHIKSQHVRHACNQTEVLCTKTNQALVVGVYSKNDGLWENAFLTETGMKYNEKCCDRLRQVLKAAHPVPKVGEVRLFYDLESFFTAVAVVGLGSHCEGYDPYETIDQSKENVRVAVGAAVRAMDDLKLNAVYVESFGSAESAAEGGALALWQYEEFKTNRPRKPTPQLVLYEDCDWTGWDIGVQKAAAQNLARNLMEAPSNVMDPITFARTSVEHLCKAGVNVEVKARDWIEIQGMGGLMAVSKGSCKEPLFMEISYYGTGDQKERPIVFVGKGCTFNSGGLGLGGPEDIKHMRGDLSGAACVVGAVRAAALLQLPLNIRGLVPLCEHMPGCNAMKPGDIATSCNGKTMYISDVRCEGQLMMADALAYGQTFWPKFVLDVGSMTKGVRSGLSTAASGVFTNSDKLWGIMESASVHTGDRMWRMPLFKHYGKKITQCTCADVHNSGRRGVGIGSGFGGDPCKAASFLREFVPCGEWMHIDNYGVMMSDGYTDAPYYRPGMAGRPTRTLIEFLAQLTCHQNM